MPFERVPGVGWSRVVGPLPSATFISAWTDGRACVISALEEAEAPDGKGDTIPQWHVSVTENRGRPSSRVLRRALRAFGMADAEEDNHHPGNARHFWKPVDPARRVDCECKATETVVREPDGYTWSNANDEACRGCEIASVIPGRACPIHTPPSSTATSSRGTPS